MPARKHSGASVTSVPVAPSDAAWNPMPLKFCAGSSLISASNDPPLVSISSWDALTPAVMLPVLVIEVKSKASPGWKSYTVAAKPAGSPSPSLALLMP
jgi:hypothetical protein